MPPHYVFLHLYPYPASTMKTKQSITIVLDLIGEIISSNGHNLAELEKLII
jgi:hypothetical protein